MADDFGIDFLTRISQECLEPRIYLSNTSVDL